MFVICFFAVVSIEQEKEFKLNELKRSIVCYRDFLGLDFETIQGFLQVSFQYIDPAEPEKRFWFMIDVDENSKYEVRVVPFGALLDLTAVLSLVCVYMCVCACVCVCVCVRVCLVCA